MVPLRARQERAFSADEYQELAEAGILGEDEHVELLGGRILAMAAKGNEHVYVTARLHAAWIAAYGVEHVRKEEPLRVGPFDVPEPDLAAVRPDMAAWLVGHPRGDEAILVAEVSVSTLDDDLDKLLVYARGGVPRVWIVDVPGRRVLVHEEPTDAGYARVRMAGEEETLELPEAARRLRVGDVLPPR